ncbi:MAG: hypothetical protein K2G72_04895 [Duncaniella sp.]|nr:hypothetical protein [Duncaniella sp.]
MGARHLRSRGILLHARIECCARSLEQPNLAEHNRRRRTQIADLTAGVASCR